MNERRPVVVLPPPDPRGGRSRRRAGFAAALAAAAAAGYGGRQVQIEIRYGEAMPVSADGWDCTSRPRLPDGTPVCFPKAAPSESAGREAGEGDNRVPGAAGDTWMCRHVGKAPHVARGPCPGDLCRFGPPETPVGIDGGLP